MNDWLHYTQDELNQTIQELADEMQDDYSLRIYALTGRTIEKSDVRCPMCQGRGSSQFDDVCTACAGEGSITDWIFTSCGHPVEGECDEGVCFEACEVMVDLDLHCGRRVSQAVAEPYTPGAFQTRCCDSCAEDFVKQGYRRVLFPDSPQLKSLSEAESERNAA